MKEQKLMPMNETKVKIYSAPNPTDLEESINLFIQELGAKTQVVDIKFSFSMMEKGGIFTGMIIYK